MNDNSAPGSWKTTQWTLVEMLKDGSHPDLQKVETLLMKHYWQPVFVYISRRGYGLHEAEDLTQSFFANVIIGRKLFTIGDKRIGRLRNLIITSLKNYLHNNYRDLHTKKSGNTPVVIKNETLLEEDQRLHRFDDPATAFDHRWVLSMIEEAASDCKEYLSSLGQEHHWAALEHAIMRPAIGDYPRPRLTAEMATQLGFTTVNHLRVSIHMTRKRFYDFLCGVIARSTQTSDEYIAEMSLVRSVLKIPDRQSAVELEPPHKTDES